jgi:hypothetical protein
LLYFLLLFLFLIISFKAGSRRGKAASKAKADVPPEADGVSLPVWQIISKLRDRYVGKCSRAEHSEKACYITNDGAHHLLTIADLTTWATIIVSSRLFLIFLADLL